MNSAQQTWLGTSKVEGTWETQDVGVEDNIKLNSGKYGLK